MKEQLKYKSPKTKEEYWSIVNTYWGDIYSILCAYLEIDHKAWIDNTVLDKSLDAYIVELKNTENPRLIRAFSFAMWNAPDDVGEWTHKNWDILSDLCAKENVFYNK